MKARILIKSIFSSKLFAITAVTLVLLSFKLETPAVSKDEFQFRKLDNNAFKGGEKLSFRVHYGLINAAKVTMEVLPTMEDVNGRKAYHVKIEGQTLKAFDWMYKVRDKFESYVDQDALCPLRYSKVVRENKYYNMDVAVYYHGKKKVKNPKGELTMPVYSQDLASAIYYARNLDFENAKLNQMFPLDVYLDNKIYNLQFKYIGKETISTDLGKIKCIKLKPKLVVDRVFKDDDDMIIWISDDKNKIPVRVQSAIQVGTVKADITSYSGLKNSFDALIKKK